MTNNQIISPITLLFIVKKSSFPPALSNKTTVQGKVRQRVNHVSTVKKFSTMRRFCFLCFIRLSLAFQNKNDFQVSDPNRNLFEAQRHFLSSSIFYDKRNLRRRAFCHDRGSLGVVRTTGGTVAEWYNAIQCRSLVSTTHLANKVFNLLTENKVTIFQLHLLLPKGQGGHMPQVQQF